MRPFGRMKVSGSFQEALSRPLECDRKVAENFFGALNIRAGELVTRPYINIIIIIIRYVYGVYSI